MLTDGSPTTILAQAAPAPMLTDGSPTTILALVALAPVLTGLSSAFATGARWGLPFLADGLLGAFLFDEWDDWCQDNHALIISHECGGFCKAR